LATVLASILSFVGERRSAPLVLGALGASVGLALHQVVDLLVFYPKVGELWWIVLGAGVAQAIALERTPRVARAHIEPRAARRLRRGLSARARSSLAL